MEETNLFDFTQGQSVNTDPFINITGNNESVNAANAALSMPTTGVELQSLSKSLIGMSMDPVTLPEFNPSFGGGNLGGIGPTGGNPFDMSNIFDKRRQAEHYDIDQSEVYTELTSDWYKDLMGFGKVAKYESYIKGVDNEDRLGKQQSTGEKWARGLETGLVTASTMVANTVGMIAYGIPKAIQEKSFNALIDNEFSRFMDDLNTTYRHENMIYKTEEYRNSSVIGQLGYSAFWADTFLQGIGYLVGGLATGMGAGAIMKGVGLAGGTIGSATRGALAETAKNVIKGQLGNLTQKEVSRQFKAAIKRDLMKTTLKSSIGNTTSLIVSAAPEAQMESLQFIKEDSERFVNNFINQNGRPPTAEETMEYREGITKAANGVFAANLALVGSSNFLQFGDLLGADKVFKKGLLDNMVNKTFGLNLEKSAIKAGAKGLASASWKAADRTWKQKAGYRVFTALQAPVSEGVWEEGMQSVVQNTAVDYMQSKFDTESTNKNKSIISSFGEGLASTYGSKEGWQEIMAGILVGAAGTVRKGRGGVDFLNQREASENIARVQANAENLNKTQEDFIVANERMLDAQNTYNALQNETTRKLNARLGHTNQQMANSDKARLKSAEGNLEQAQLYYTNSVFAKLMAEERAGLSESNKFDMEMMIDTIPDEALREMYGFDTQEDIDAFKESTKKTLNNQREAFKVANQFAEQLNLGSTNTMHSGNLHEAAALNFFHGLMAADTATTIGKTLNDITGIDGVASAFNYYQNLDETNKKRVQKIKEGEELIEQLQQQSSELLSKFSTLSEKSAREPENEAIVKQLDSVSQLMESVNSRITQLSEENTKITQILNDRANIPQLPFGNPASKFFAGIDLNIADTDVSTAMGTLESYDNYINNLLDTTGKTREQVEQDVNKAQVLSDLTNMYRNQMKLMRNFAKAGNMVADPAYGNTLFKKLRNKKATRFNNDDWAENDTSGMDIANEGKLNRKATAYSAELQKLIDEGKVSELDLQTWRTNIEILSMSGYVIGGSKITLDELNSIITTGENGNLVYDTESDLGQSYIVETVLSLEAGMRLTPAQSLVYQLNKELINKEVESLRGQSAASVSSVVTPGKNSKLKEEVRLKKIADRKIEKIRENFLERYPLSEIVSGQITLPNIPEDPTLDEIIVKLEEMLEEEFREVNQQLQEALAPTQNETIQTKKTLDLLNEAIDEIVDNIESQNKQINRDFVSEFEVEDIPVKEEFERASKLLSLGVLSQEEQNELSTLLDRINNYGLIEGRVGDADQIRLSDLLEQRAQLENEVFNEVKPLTLISNDTIREITTDEILDTSEEEVKSGQKTGDAGVLNNYEFTTFTKIGPDHYQISNLTPQGLVEEITINKDFTLTVVDNKGQVKQIDTQVDNWDSQIAEGDTLKVDLINEDGSRAVVSFSVDASRRNILPIVDAEVISDHTNLSFNPKNIIGKSAHYVLTKDNNGVEVYVGSDFDLEIDSEAAQNLVKGDEIYFEVDTEAPYNISLMEELDREVGIITSNDRANADLAQELLDEIVENIALNKVSRTKARTERNSDLYLQIKQIFPEVNSSPASIQRKINSILVPPVSKKADDIRKKFKNNMVIVAKDKSGNRVGIVKSLGNASIRGAGKTKLDHLRSSLFQEFENSNYSPGTRTKFKLPVSMVYMGIPNVREEGGNKVQYRFSTEPGDMNIHPSAIKAVGYVTHGEMKFSGNKTFNTPYNYAKSILDNTLYADKRVPVVVFNHAGKEIIYPVTMLENDTTPLSERFQEILDKRDTVSLSEFITEANDFLAANGISKGVRFTSFNLDQSIAMATDIINDIPNIPTLEQFMDPLTSQSILQTNVLIDININDRPFIGPKVRFNLNNTPESNSPLLEQESTVGTITPSTMAEIAAVEENTCLD